MPRGKGATFGFIGFGEVKTRATNAILEDQFEAADGNVRFILPITKEHFTDGIQLAADFARKNDIPYEIVVDETTAKMKDAKEYVADAVKEHKVARIPHKIVALLEKAGNGKLVVFWDADEDDGAIAFAKAYDADIPAFDIVNGFEPLTYGEDSEEPEADADPEETDGDESEDAAEDDEKPARSRRSVEDDVEDDEEEEPSGDDEYVPESAAEQRAQKIYTEEYLSDADIRELKAICDSRGIEIPPRTRVPTYVKKILAWQEEHAPEGVDAETGEVVDDSDDEHVDLPEHEDEEVRLPKDDDDVRPVGTPQLVGSCAGCGGPIFASGDQPKVKWHHAAMCMLDNEDAFERHYDAMERRK